MARSWLKKNWLNLLLGLFILLMLFYPPAKIWVLQRVMDTGLFNPKTNEHPSYYAQPMEFRSADGKSLRTDQMQGKTVFINFWATWCPPCLAELPSIQTLYNKFRSDTTVIFILADVDNRAVESQAFLKRRSLDLPVYTISTSPDPSLYKGSLPTTIILDGEGKVLLNHSGIGRYDTDRVYELMSTK